jgi:hypothetical protein
VDSVSLCGVLARPMTVMVRYLLLLRFTHPF